LEANIADSAFDNNVTCGS